MTQISGLTEEKTTTHADDLAAVDDSQDSWTSKKVKLTNWFNGIVAKIGSIELNGTANTLTASGGVLSIEGVVIPSISSTNTLTNKRITKRVATGTDDATAVIDSDSYDEYYLTAIENATEITVTGTPTAGQTIFIGLKDAGVTKGLTWTGITALDVTLPTATTAGKQHIIGIKYIASAWRAIAVGEEV